MKIRTTVLLVALCLAASSLAQQNNPSSLFARDSTEGVYVRDSAVAAEKMALAFRLEHLKEWNKAADVYQELLQQYADRVTPSDERDQRIYQYTSVAIAVQQKLAKWPQEGLDAYRGKFEPEAASLLEQAGSTSSPQAGADLAALHKIVSQYFITDAAREAAIRIIDADMESGDFASAAWMGDRLLNLHPNLGALRPMLLYRTAIAYRLAGNSALASARGDELKKDFAGVAGTIAGKDVVLADSLAEQLKLAKPVGESARNDSWPMAFGSVDRARVPNVAGFGGAKLFGIELTKENLKNIPNPAQRQQVIQQNRTAREAGMMTGVMPVVDRGELFFQDNARIYAVSLDSGLPLAGWASTWDGDRNGRYSITAWSTPRNTQYTLALTDDSVLAIMGQMDLQTMLVGLTLATRDTRLVCLDRHTGKDRWVVRPAALPEPYQGLELTGTPLVVNDSVFVTGHSTTGVQFQDCYLLCFDLSGHFRFASYIASANSGSALFDGDFANMNQDVPQLAYSSGRVFVLSNLGALAAVDAYDGTIVWLSLYPRQQNNELIRQFGFRGGWNRIPTQSDNDRPWTQSPVVVSDGNVFVVPSDGQCMVIYDAATGGEVKRIKLSDLKGAETILGVIDDRIVFEGSSGEGADERARAMCLNWRNYDAVNYKPGNADMLLWQTSYTDKASSRSGLRGRGFLTTDAVYLPTQNKLLKIDLKGGRLLARYPEEGREWDESESSGNILVTQDHLIVAGPERVNVYTDLTLAREKLDKEVAAAPEDPEVRLRYAEVMFVAGQFDVAVAKLDEAIQVIGGLEKNTDAPARDRIYTCAMAFAEKLSREKDVDVDMCNGLYDRAAKAATTPQQQVNYRISRARFAMDNKDDFTELKLLQEIVSEPSWRVVPVVQQDAAGPAQAAAVAEKLITDIIQRSPAVYAPVAEQAQKAFDAAQTAADPGKLLAVAQTYPNSTVAPEALLKAADAYEAVGNSRQAGQILRQLYFKYPLAPNRAVVIEALARNYLATPNHLDIAIARLAQGAKLPDNPKLTRPLTLPDGTVIKDVTFSEALAALQKYHEQQAVRALPDFGLPPPANVRNGKPFVKPTEPIATRITAIVTPLRDFARNDRIVTYSAGSGVAVYPVGAAEPILTSKAITDTPVNCAWVSDNLLVWSTSRIVMLKPDGSTPMWDVELRTIPVVEVATRDDDNAAPINDGMAVDQLNLNNGQVIFLQGGQRIIRRGNGFLRLPARINVNVNNNNVAIVPAGAEQIWKVGVVSDRVVLATTTGRMIALDMADGKTIWQMRPSDRPLQSLLVSDDFVVGQINDGTQIRVIALDTYSGQMIMHREFPVDGTGLVNLALSPDGKLVYLMLDRVECKDLFEPGDRPAFTPVQVRRSDGNGAFMGAIQPDQLILSEGRIIAVSDEGRFIRAYSLENGKVLHGNAAGAPEGVDNIVGLSTQAQDWKVLLQAVGSRVYAIGERTLVAYNLDQLSDTWHDSDFNDHVAKDVMIGKDFLLIVAEFAPTNHPNPRTQFPNRIALRAYSRAIVGSGRESGLIAYVFPITSPAGIQNWQGVDGGVYYLTGDQKLYFLKGGRE